MTVSKFVGLAMLLAGFAASTVWAQSGDRGAIDPFARAGYDPAVEPSAASKAPPRVTTRQNTFAIPFTIEKPLPNGPVASEVQLFVADTPGAEWRLESRVAADKGRFLFRAPRDGEYWFQVRTMDQGGRLLGVASNEPELRVLVDTARPSLDMQVRMLPDTRLEVTYEATDAELSLKPLNLKYRVASNGAWQPLPGFVNDVRGDDSSKLQGQHAWASGVTEGAISLRGEVVDVAGNRQVITRRIHIGEQLAKLREQQQQPNQQQLVRQQPIPPYPPVAGERPLYQHQPPVATRPRADGSVGWPTDRQATAPLGPNSNLPKIAGAPAPPNGPRTEQPHPQVSEQYRPGETRPMPPPQGNAALAPRFVKSKSFLLDYGIDKVTGNRRKIVLWSTRDGGRSWSRFGEDPDGQSPFEVTVAEPGLYGFSIVADANDAPQEYVPRSGEAAQSWIMIDPDPPKARLTALEIDPNGREPSLQIRWEAFDENLPERPVSLYLSDRPDGQWFRIATDLENSGRYQWRLDEGLPAEIYLRLVVRDMAGNTQEHIADRPIQLEELRPNVQIQGVRSSQRSAQQYLFLQ